MLILRPFASSNCIDIINITNTTFDEIMTTTSPPNGPIAAFTVPTAIGGGYPYDVITEKDDRNERSLDALLTTAVVGNVFIFTAVTVCVSIVCIVRFVRLRRGKREERRDSIERRLIIESDSIWNRMQLNTAYRLELSDIPQIGIYRDVHVSTSRSNQYDNDEQESQNDAYELVDTGYETILDTMNGGRDDTIESEEINLTDSTREENDAVAVDMIVDRDSLVSCGVYESSMREHYEGIQSRMESPDDTIYYSDEFVPKTPTSTSEAYLNIIYYESSITTEHQEGMRSMIESCDDTIYSEASVPTSPTSETYIDKTESISEAENHYSTIAEAMSEKVHEEAKSIDKSQATELKDFDAELTTT